MSNPVNKASAGPMLVEMIAQNPHTVEMYDGKPGVALAKKVKYGGDKYHFEIEYGSGDNTSYDATVALQKRNLWSKARFECETVESYDATDVTHRALRECQDDDAFIDLLTNLKQCLDQRATEAAEIGLFQDHGNALARARDVTAGVITLYNAADTRRFSLGMRVRLADTDGTSGSLRAGTASITAIDEDAGTLTVAGNWTDVIAAAVDDDYLFRDGSFGNGRQGLPAWVPFAKPSATLFNAVDRTPHNRLYGHRQTAARGDIAASLRAICTSIKANGGKGTDTFLCSVELLSAFTEQQEQKVTYETLSGESVMVGIESIKFQAAGIKLNLVDCWAAPDNAGWAIPRKDLELIHSTNGLHEVVDEDGNIFARNANDFTYDVRTIAIFNYVLRNLAGSGVVVYS